MELKDIHHPATAPEASPAPEKTVEECLSELFPAADRPLLEAKSRCLGSEDPSDWDAVSFPIELALELVSACNLSCVMCPVPTTTRPAKLMEEAIFRRTVDDVAALGGFLFLPQGFGESFLHPRWADLLAYARQRDIRPIVLLTNGMLLEAENTQRLLDIDLDAVVVSIDGVNPETYASVRVGGDLLKVEENVKEFLRRRGDARTPHLILRIIRMRETEAEIEAFYERWRPLLAEGDTIQINEFNDWSGKVEDRSITGMSSGPPRGPCRMLWKNLSVHADGKVSACCHDSEDELLVGDLSDGETVQEIWRGEKLARLRRLHLERRITELPICARCNNWI